MACRLLLCGVSRHKINFKNIADGYISVCSLSFLSETNGIDKVSIDEILIEKFLFKI